MPYALVKQADMYSTASRIYGKITVYVEMLMSTTTVPMTTKLGRMVTYYEGLLSWSRLTFWSHGLAKSHDKLKSYLLYHIFYNYLISMMTYPKVSTHKVTWFLSYVILRGNVTN